MSTIKGKINVNELTDSLRKKIEQTEQIKNKVDREEGMGLSECNFTKEYKEKLDNNATNTYTHPDTHPASMITVNNSNFNSNNLDEILNELFTNADNGQKSISGVIGNPLSASDDFNSMKTKIENIKKIIASNLTSKGQNSTYTETLNGLANKIGNISIGDYKIGDKIPLNKFTYNYITNSLSSYAKEDVIETAEFINTNQRVNIYMDKNNNMLIINDKNAYYYNYSTKKKSTICSNIPSTSVAYVYYDEPNDQFYLYYGDYTYLYVHKVNKCYKQLYCTETKNDCTYSNPAITQIIVDSNGDAHIYYSIYYSASGCLDRKFKITSNGVQTSTEESSHINRSENYIFKIPNTSNYYFIDTYTERVKEYSSSGTLIQTIELPGLLKSTKTIACISENTLLLEQSIQIKILDLSKKEFIKDVYAERGFVFNNKDLMAVSTSGNTITKIKKYTYNTLNLIYEMEPPQGLSIYNGSYNIHNIAYYYNELIYMYSNVESKLDSITLK